MVLNVEQQEYKNKERRKNMSNYKKAECPYCGKQTPSGRNIDSPNKNVDKVICTSCHKHYKIIYGEGRIRSEEQ